MKTSKNKALRSQKTVMHEAVSVKSSSCVSGWWAYTLLLAAVLLAYANTCDNSFLYDDDMLIVRNAALRSWHSFGSFFISSLPLTLGKSAFYRPVQMTAYMIIVQLFGLSVLPFHLLNIFLHAANTILVFSLGLRLGFRRSASFFAALIWALHPFQTEAVAYISASAELLYSFFVLAALCLVLPVTSPRRLILAAIAYVLALLSKETAVIFPFLLGLCLYYGRIDPRDKKLHYFFAAIAFETVFYLALHLWLIDPQTMGLLPPSMENTRANQIVYRTLAFFSAVPAYAQIIFWPAGLHMERGYTIPPGIWEPAVQEGLVILALLFCALFLSRIRPLSALGFGILWLMIAGFLHTGILMPLDALVLEHWLYLPSVGFFLGIAETCAKGLDKIQIPKMNSGVAGVCCFLAAVLGFLTYRQNEVWANPVTFYTNIFQYEPRSARAHANLGVYYAQQKDFAAAIDQFRTCNALLGIIPECHYDLAVMLLSGPGAENHIEEAETEFKRTLEIKSDYYTAYYQLAAIAHYRKDAVQEKIYLEQGEAAKKKLSALP